jgi:hypothetical protein
VVEAASRRANVIVGSSWNYAKNFFEFARKFILALSNDDFGAALARLDRSKRRWTGQELLAAIRQRESGKITSPLGHERSASPQLTTPVPNEVFEVCHRLPVDGRWSETVVRFRFERARGEYFHVELLGFEAYQECAVEPDHAASFLAAASDLRAWVDTIPPAHRNGEWECDYPRWDELVTAWEALLDAPAPSLEPQLVETALFAIARDNECSHMINALQTLRPDWMCRLAEASLVDGEPDARWQLADALGDGGRGNVEPLLLRFVNDSDEYVRRRALASLARIGSSETESAALRAWAEGSDAFPWPRMQALWALHRIGSQRLASLLADAETSSNEHLRHFAARVRSGDVER